MLGIGLVIYLLWESCRKVIKIQSRNAEINEDCFDTYCIISLYLAALTQIALIVSLLQFAMTVVVVWYSAPGEAAFTSLFLFGYRTVQTIWEYLLMSLFFVQLIEWWVMLFLIKFEQKYTLDEIVYLQQNTDTFVQKEKRLYCRIATAFTLFNILIVGSEALLYVSDLPADPLRRDRGAMVKNLFYGISLTVFMSAGLVHLAISFRLYQLMKVHHNFEFQRTRRAMLVQILVVLLYYGVGILFYIFIMAKIYQALKRGDYMLDSLSPWKTKYCLTAKEALMVWGHWILQLPMIMACFTIVKVKSSRDIIQGISKLDYLYKVSRFQIDKQERDEDLQEYARTLYVCWRCHRSRRWQNLHKSSLKSLWHSHQ